MTTKPRLGHVHLKVRDLATSVEFYCRLFDLEVEEQVGGYAFLTDGVVHHVIALQALGSRAVEPHPLSIGLYHTAFEVESTAKLGQITDELSQMKVAHQLVDHRISWALYFNDPDGNGLEVYLDRRQAIKGKSDWQGQSQRLTRADLERALSEELVATTQS